MGATSVANPAPQPTPPKQYDPIKVAEGMFSGSINRIGQALRDREYVANSKVILAECTKRYQDALDDCEIQILDAKWYLESKLAANRARREAEAKAKEATATSATSAATKRKREEIEDTSASLRPDAPAKRARSNEPPSPRATAAVQNVSSAQGKDTAAESDKKPQGPTTKPPDTAKDTAQPPEQEKAKGEAKTEPQARPETQQEQPPDNDEFLKSSSPQGTSEMTNGDYIFESMFGEPNETNDPSAMDNDNMDGEFNFGDDFSAQHTTTAASASVPASTNDNQSQQQQPQPPSQPQNSNPLNSLLAGVEQFANQTDDANNLGLDGTAPDSNNATNDQQPHGDSNVFTADFGPNIFDMEFNDENNFDMDDIENIGDPGQQEINFDDF